MKIDGKTRVVGVFGDPIEHTASPAMHNAAFQSLGMNWCYLPFNVNPVDLDSALRGIREMNFVGVNLTVPHKIFAMNLVDEVDPLAGKLGAVNTVVVTRDRKLVGHNTDGHGLVTALEEDFGLQLKGKRIMILGAGGRSEEHTSE